MSQYKLTYFNVKALGEPIRMILHYMGKDFEDERVSLEEWQKLKQRSPFGKLPTLEVDGKVLHQSNAVCRYLAKEANLRGSNDWEDLQIDIIVDTFQDFRKEVSLFHHEPDPAVKETKKAKILNETLPYYFSKFDKMVEENKGYFANGKLSWADFYLGGFSDSLVTLLGVDIYADYPNLKTWRAKFFEIPQVKDWISKRPQTAL
ncbi:glutathione S-transferase-like [Cimex lectularius]|uniref:glutathione transferase n=1 Tax=Cimex lectularius TaxID=79782 RepID=A0A8I6S214_CIMLE|nr:glutathione S-transferase-like [Cimex lectularius]